MAMAMYFHPQGFSAGLYDDAIKRLEDAGQGRPDGRLHHSAFGPSDNLMIYDVWESQAQFDKFGETLIPILTDLGVDPGAPDVMELHNFIQ
jgi:hypothetical protein